MTGIAADTAMRRWLIRLAGDGAEIWQHSVSPWRSITFSGERHAICLKLSTEEQVARLSSADLEVMPVRGALVVEATVTGSRWRQTNPCDTR
ncbi:MAG: hypothetical protein B7X90_01830 [Novosphingobium sp. 17-62-19]|uniref:hypothetical protein n=1 Tax=Novosphingobium sp. 17-62-19 TaxID=1970406 RepID=UPI000BDA92DC|nr:hypothetical protein [Novosphingobium sp. 17-62-19]OZA21377.1 MAG: hypothetical protein B7X90_01830 [Novosphingobium sp. 17-62-19]HQS95078.1 hypothetical protein [Novosphingobium sp.]